MGLGCIPSLLFDLRPNCGGDNKHNGDLLQKVPCMHCHTQCPWPCSRPLSIHASARDSWTLTGKSGSVSCGVIAPFSWVLVHTRFCLWLPSSVSPVLCKFWWLYGGVNGDLLQEGLCHTQFCCTQSPCLCSRPLLTHTSPGDTQTLKGRSGSVSVVSLGTHNILFEPSKCLWWVWHLILNVISSLLPSCCSFSFALGRGISFFGGIQHSPVDGCSAVSCNYGVLLGEDDHPSSYSAILPEVRYIA